MFRMILAVVALACLAAAPTPAEANFRARVLLVQAPPVVVANSGCASALLASAYAPSVALAPVVPYGVGVGFGAGFCGGFGGGFGGFRSGVFFGGRRR